MEPFFLDALEKSHRTDCERFWGPEFQWDIKALRALGELRLALDIHPVLKRLKVNRSGRQVSVPIALNEVMRLFEKTYDKSQLSLGLLSDLACELASPLGPVRTSSRAEGYLCYEEVTDHENHQPSSQ
jgi:hypothetical protein